jgi:uncharacterized protein with gpF-like domain
MSVRFPDGLQKMYQGRIERATKRLIQDLTALGKWSRRQADFEYNAESALKALEPRFERIAQGLVDDLIRSAQRGIESPVKFDEIRRAAMRLRTYGALQAHARKTLEAAKGYWTPEEGLKGFDPREHLNRAAFYAMDQTGFLYGAAQKELAESSGARRYVWLRTSSKNPRDWHLDRVGKTFRFGELDDEPGVLPNCKCSLRPIYD